MPRPLFHKLSIKQKLILLVMSVSGCALLLITLMSGVTQIRILHQAMLDNLTILADSVSQHSIKAVETSDVQLAQETLQTLKADREIELAVIYDRKDTLFAYYTHSKTGNGELKDKKLPKSVHQNFNRFLVHEKQYKLEIFRTITIDGFFVGTLYIRSKTGRMMEHLQRSGLSILLSLLFVMAITLLAVTRLQARITEPVYVLAKTARRISTDGDYSVRAATDDSPNEMSQLIDDFNRMLEAVEVRDGELKQHRQNLEQLVFERTEELRAKRDEALAAARAKSEFLANMSHEIRTPINGIVGVLSLLKDAALDKEQWKLLKSASKSADTLLLIIDDVLDFTKIDAGKISFETIPFGVREVVEELTEMFADLAHQKNLKLNCYIPIDIPYRVAGDPTRLRQILTNLISNAIKFTEQGEIQIQVGVKQRQDEWLELVFTVEDTGIGIAQEAMEYLFDKFTQADGSITRKYGGTGLGLSVCKQLVEMQQGQIGVEPREEQGSMFWFSLPFNIAEDAVILLPYSQLEGNNYLLIDGDETLNGIIGDYLGGCNATLTTCTSYESSLQQIAVSLEAGRSLDAILLCHDPPQMDGIVFAEFIRRKYGEALPQIILLSVAAVPLKEMRGAGITGMVFKPLRALDFYYQLGGLQTERDLIHDYGGLVRNIPPLTGSVLLVEDEPVNQKVIGAILQKLGMEVEVAATGQEALFMTSDKHYSLILLDLQMPEMSGFEVARRIRRREKSLGREKLVLIAITANVFENTRKKCLDSGMDDYITKPIKPELLAERLRPWLNQSELNTIAAASPEKQSQPPEPHSDRLWSDSLALEYVGGDADVLLDLIEMFLGRKKKMLATIERAIVDEDSLGLREAAHAYKSALNHFGAGKGVQLTLSLEKMGKSGVLQSAGEIYQALLLESERLEKALSGFAEQYG